MGLDRVVMLLINSADMSAAEAAGTARRSPATLQAGPPTGTVGTHHPRPTLRPGGLQQFTRGSLINDETGCLQRGQMSERRSFRPRCVELKLINKYTCINIFQLRYEQLVG